MAYEIEKKSLKQMPQICDHITVPFEDFDLVVEAFDKTVRLTADEVIRDLIRAVLQGRKETVKAIEPTIADTLHPAFNSCSPGFFGVLVTGKIWTVDKKRLEVEAVAVLGNHIAAVCSTQKIRK